MLEVTTTFSGLVGLTATPVSVWLWCILLMFTFLPTVTSRAAAEAERGVAPAGPAASIAATATVRARQSVERTSVERTSVVRLTGSPSGRGVAGSATEPLL